MTYETKYYVLRTVSVILLFWKIATSSPTSVFRLISDRQIFYNEDIVMISSIQRNLANTNTANTDDLMSDQPNLVYAILKCKYSDVIVELLRTFYEINEYGLRLKTPKEYTVRWLKSSVDHFQGVKRPIAKMIDYLFTYMDRYVVLKSSEQLLLKSLLSINLFLYYIENDNPMYCGRKENPYQTVFANTYFEKIVDNIRKLNASIIQMIGLVERFRNKRCVVHDPYKQNFVIDEKLRSASIKDETYVKDLLVPTMEKLHLLVNNGSDDYSEFQSHVYDPEYLLFGNLLKRDNGSFLNDVRIRRNGKELDLLSMYDEIKSAYSVHKILEFQHLLINVIADTFYGQIYNVLTEQKDYKYGITRLLVNFDKFIEHMMPSNCSINVCNAILKSHVILSKALERFEDLELFTVLENQFKPEKIQESFYRNVKRAFVDDPYLDSFVYRMRHDQQHASFAKAFKLLSHEIHTNGDHDIVRKFGETETFDPRSYDLPFLKRMIQLQYCLLAFRAYLIIENGNKIPTYGLRDSNLDLNDFRFIGIPLPGNEENRDVINIDTQCHEYQKYGPVLANLLRVIVKMYKLSRDRPDVQNILLPVLIRLRRADHRNCHKIHSYECQAILQTCFVLITLVENYIIKTDFFSFSSLVVYRKFLMYDKNGPSASKLRHDIKTFAENISTEPTTCMDSFEFVSLLYDENVYDAFFVADDKEIQFLWNGGVHFGYEIYRSVARGVIDFNDLINFQWFGVKWFVGKILLVIINRLSSLYNKPHTIVNLSDELTIITVKLYEILAPALSKSFYLFLGDIIEAINKILNVNSTGFSSSTYEQLVNLFDCCFQSLGLYKYKSEMTNYSRIEAFNSVINFNIGKYKKFLNCPILKTHNIFTLSDFTPSPIENTISNETINMIY